VAITQSEITKTVEHYKETNGVDIRHLGYDDQRMLTEIYMRGAEKAVQMLLDRAKQIEMDIVDRVANVGKYSDD